MVKLAPDPLPLVLDWPTFENVDCRLQTPLMLAAFIPEAAVPVADAAIAPLTVELPEAETAVTVPVKS